ncbi:NCS1 family nucleobase:cation symporter-1 [Paracoccus sulfuroxidans]|uniref:NCS1 family nucleobase:cation symporter-1 n=1 Tax=Paracoccus sulfuroxidans TaxID=384678 RepID=A0A562NNL6_9RHOB|nr:NCS1 family nucleobase:cation symporter-1 [Paracoccus sulfuroxidans]TWI33758.1 NCS1 family nucleobase:cation symporter-1 [Paracoccus sulfuroxidans]
MHSNSPSSPALPVSDRLSNHDIAPVKNQDWGVYNLSAMWMSNVHSVAGYVFAASLFTLGLGGFQVFSALIAGIMLIYVFTNLAGRAGQKYGIAFAAFCRPAFGVFGANIPSMIKASTATCWYGIQTWVASTALVVVTLRLAPGSAALNDNSILGMSTLGWICFLVMWFSQLAVFYYGWEAIRKFTDWAGPAIYLVMFLLAGWIVWKAGGLQHIDFSLSSEQLTGGQAISAWFTAVAFTVAWFAGTTLNFADFSRFLKSRKAMQQANFLGLPINFALFALVTVVTTSGALKVFGELITDPVHLVARLDNVTAIMLGALTFMTATIATNIVANFVSAAMDLTNLAPKYLTFRRAGVLASLLSVAVMPWKLYSDPVMVQYTLGTLGSFIGPIFGVIICDYYFIRRQQIDLDSLYSEDPRGKYWYSSGFNVNAIIALVLAAAVALSISQLSEFSGLAAFSWFFGAAAGGLFHYLLSGQKARA